jgi:hypothetical protein
LLVRFKSGDPFAGVCLNIRKRGVDTSILLRAQLTRIGTEMWVKVYSPTVVGIEVVQRAEKRARRARLYYMRFVHLLQIYQALLLTLNSGNPSMTEETFRVSWTIMFVHVLCSEEVLVVVDRAEEIR